MIVPWLDIFPHRLCFQVLSYTQKINNRLDGRLISKSSRKFQTWTIAGWLLAKLLREHLNYLNYICFEEDTEAIACTI